MPCTWIPREESAAGEGEAGEGEGEEDEEGQGGGAGGFLAGGIDLRGEAHHDLVVAGGNGGGAEDPVGAEQIQRRAVNGGRPAVRVIDLTEYDGSGGRRAVVVTKLVRSVGGH